MPSHTHPILPPEESSAAVDTYVIQVYGELKAQLARMEAKLDGMEERSAEERDALRESQGKFDARMDAFDDLMRPLKFKQEHHEKTLTGLETSMLAVSGAYSRILGSIAVISVGGSLLLSGIYWALTHWGEVMAMLWIALGGGQNGPPAH